MIKKPLITVHVRRGGNVKIPATPTAPVISRIDGGHFSIFWPGQKPVDWAVQVQAEPDGEWDIATIVAGNVRLVALTGAPYAARIVGRDSEHNPVTDVSNVLILNPVTAPPAPAVSSLAGDIEATTPTGHQAAGPAESNWLLYQSESGTGNPDTNPSEWERGGALSSASGTHAAWGGVDYAHWYLAAYVENGTRSAWSDKAQLR